MELGKKLMKIVVKVADVRALAHRFAESPALAMQELVTGVQEAFASSLERVMDAEITVFLGQPVERGNKRNGYTSRTFAVHGIGIAWPMGGGRDRKRLRVRAGISDQVGAPIRGIFREVHPRA